MSPSSITIELVGPASLRMRGVHAVMRATTRPAVDAFATVASLPRLGRPCFRLTNRLDVLATPLHPARGTLVRPEQFPDFPAEWLWHEEGPGPEHTAGGVIVYLHGGGFITGGLNSHRRLTARLARACGLPLLNVAYRQLPDALIPTSIEDALTAYRHVLGLGFAPERVVFAGDSAGGGLTFAAVLAARDRGLPMPGGIAAMSPWSDMEPAPRLRHPNDRTDALLSAHSLGMLAREFAELGGGLDPAWSPANHDFTGLPPIFIQSGSTEALLPDGETLARRCAEAGVPCTLQIWDHGIHVFQALADLLPDGRAAIAEMATFIVRATRGEAVAHGLASAA